MGIDGPQMKTRRFSRSRRGAQPRHCPRRQALSACAASANSRFCLASKRRLAALRAAGFLLIVVTNQPDVARGATTREAVEEINAALGAALPIDEFRTCFHDSGRRLRLPQAEARRIAGGGGASRY